MSDKSETEDLNVTSSSENSSDHSERSKKSRKKDRRDKSTSPSPSVSEGIYEVEYIVDYSHDESGDMYLVKWKNWDQDFNTWESPSNLLNCENAMIAFYMKRKAEAKSLEDRYANASGESKRKRGPLSTIVVPPDPRTFEVRVQEFFKATIPVSEEEILEFQEFFLTNYKKLKSSRWPQSKLNKYIQDGADRKLSEEQLKALRQQLMFVELDVRRANVHEELQKWQNKMNAISKEHPEIVVENDVDLCGPPTDFEYINDYITGVGVQIPDDPLCGCSCSTEKGCFGNRKQCSKTHFGPEFAYSAAKRVKVDVGTPIFECNRKCKCGPDCPNRVVQDGTINCNHKLSIFRTNNGCGWGVKTTKLIRKGTYVTLYAGEIINTEEAERRGRLYDEEGATYLFDLDFNMQDSCPFTIDAAKFGNISHFINHSCNPNVGVFAVWVNCVDPNLPKLALFALRDICRNEEITFDYKNQLSSQSRAAAEDVDSSSDKTPTRHKRCMCGETNCRGILF